MKDFEKRVIDVMIQYEEIPEEGFFQIGENHLSAYIKTYGEIFGNKGIGLSNKNEYRFARKLAGRTLVRLLYERGAKLNQIDAGMVYVISNPAFEKHLKIGMTMDVIDRLSQYQTYDPYRAFKLEKYNFVLNRKQHEKLLLTHPDIINESGEWVLKENVEQIFNKLSFVR